MSIKGEYLDYSLEIVKEIHCTYIVRIYFVLRKIFASSQHDKQTVSDVFRGGTKILNVKHVRYKKNKYRVIKYFLGLGGDGF